MEADKSFGFLVDDPETSGDEVERAESGEDDVAAASSTEITDMVGNALHALDIVAFRGTGPGSKIVKVGIIRKLYLITAEVVPIARLGSSVTFGKAGPSRSKNLNSLLLTSLPKGSKVVI